MRCAYSCIAGCAVWEIECGLKEVCESVGTQTKVPQEAGLHMYHGTEYASTAVLRSIQYISNLLLGVLPSCLACNTVPFSNMLSTAVQCTMVVLQLYSYRSKKRGRVATVALSRDG